MQRNTLNVEESFRDLFFVRRQNPSILEAAEVTTATHTDAESVSVTFNVKGRHQSGMPVFVEKERPSLESATSYFLINSSASLFSLCLTLHSPFWELS